MLTQSDLFTPAETVDDDAASVVTHQLGEPIAVPCGFRDRHNNPCHRLENWPIMDGAKQMLCRGRPMIHCDAACFRGDPPAPAHHTAGEDVVWGDGESEYGDDQ